MKLKDLFIIIVLNFVLVFVFSFLFIPMIISEDFHQQILDIVDNESKSVFKELEGLKNTTIRTHNLLLSMNDEVKLILKNPMKIQQMSKQIDAIESDTKTFRDYVIRLSGQSRNIEELTKEIHGLLQKIKD